MALSVNPKGGHAGTVSVRPKSRGCCDPSDNHPKSRTYHPYSDKMIDAAAKRDRERFDYKRESAAFDRQRKRLNDAKRRGRVIYG